MHRLRLIMSVTAVIWILFAGLAKADDADAGEMAVARCKGCHQFSDKARNAFGPVLRGVVGRPAASYDGYRYSKDLAAAGEAGLVWTPEEIDTWLMGASAYLRARTGNPSARSKMPISVSSADKRAAIIAYLTTLSQK